MNKQGPKGIEWCDWTWNPIKGLCPEGCWYCYARATYRRFKLDERLEFHVTRGEIAKMDRLRPSRIFVCSTMEMFSPRVEAEWRDKIFQTFEMFPKHTFIILTKRPENIDRPMPPNVWLGASVTGANDWYRVGQLALAQAGIKFVSIEPFFGRTPRIQKKDKLDWIIVGRLTGRGRVNNPEYSAVGWIIAQATEIDIPIFLKNNLKDICRPLIQEFPKGVSNAQKP